MDKLKLKNGSHIVIIGGGPAGTSTAIKLMNESKRVGIDINVTLFEGKDFDSHSNKCIGVLSPPFISLFQDELGIELPKKLIRRKINGYCLNGNSQSVLLNDFNTSQPTYVVKRIEFDNFMLKSAKQAGVRIIKARATYVEFIKEAKTDEVRIFGETGFEKADVVVCAFGLDEAMLGVFEKMTPKGSRYVRPKEFLRSYIVKILADKDFIDSTFKNTIYAYIQSKVPSIEFGAVTPKDNYIMVNIAGKDVLSTDVLKFLDLPNVKAIIPENIELEKFDFLEGMFPTSFAKNAYGDRFVFVGDSTGWMRPFKGKGINTAFFTGVSAAKTMIEHGISKEAFKKYDKMCNSLKDDYYFGLTVRFLTHITSKFNIFDLLLEVSNKDQILKKALFDSVSGHDNYKNIVKGIMNPKTIISILRKFFRI